tara:strand:- start:2349 stop:2756 length:408 start_codon:yes stop_codon:yes gene_type:complete
MSSFLEINTDFSSDSDSSELSTPRKMRLLRIDTKLDLRSNTPSPPPIERRRTPLRRVQSMPLCGISPRPDKVLKLIQTPNRLIKNKRIKLKIEKEVRDTINELILNVEKRDIIKEFEKSVHLSSQNLHYRNFSTK